MAKRKRSRPNKFSQGKVSDGIGSAYDDGYKTLVDPNSRDNIYDEVEQYHDDIKAATLSEALSRMKTKQVKKETVLSLGMDSSDEEEFAEEEEDESEESDESEEEEAPEQEEEDEDESEEEEGLRPFLENDDIIEEREDKLPDERAWGKDKSLYYGTNVTDQIIRKRATHLHISEVHDVTTRELAANKAYQRRMADSLKGLDYMEMLQLGEEVEAKKEKKKSSKSDAKLVFTPQDTENMSKAQKLKLLKQLSPEYFPLVNDAVDKLEENINLLEPVLKAHKDGLLGPCPALEYVRTKFRLTDNYVLVVLTYMMLIRSIGHNAIKTHPVMEKLARYRFLFQNLEQIDTIMKPQLEILLHRIKTNIPLSLLHPPTAKSLEKPKNGKVRKLSILNKKKSTTEEPSAKKVKLVMAEESDSDDGANVTSTAVEEEVDGDTRRRIGKMITKNRGLTPHRKKELKNPRIKYKTKYIEKVKRRKGQVRPVRDQIPAYCGEKTGINMYAIKSRKLT